MHFLCISISFVIFSLLALMKYLFYAILFIGELALNFSKC